MNREQAKEILSAYRPGTEDEHDPVFAEALRLVRQDAELAAWFQERQVFDAAVSRRLAAVVPPTALLEQMGAARRRREAVYRRRLWMMAAAACLTLLLGLAGLWWRSERPRQITRFAAFRGDMVESLRQFPRLDLETRSLAEARRWLTETRHLQNVVFPAGLQRFPTIGCRTLEWHGNKLALVCFMMDGEVVHFIVIPRDVVPDGPRHTTPELSRVAGTSTASWSRGGYSYLVLTKASMDFLRARL